MMLRSITLLVSLSLYLYAEEIAVDATAITKAHNDLRQKQGVPALTYSKTLEAAAGKWAAKLQEEGCVMRHSHGKVGTTGENLFWSSPVKTATTKDDDGKWIWHRQLKDVKEQKVVQAWYDEVKWFDYATNSCTEKQMCGHYTQVIWSTTTELGCAAAACDDRSQVWVCEYSPPGNVSVRDASGKIEKLRPY